MMSFFMKSLCRTGPQVLIFLQLNDTIRRLVFILFSTSELGVTFVVCRGLGSLKNSVVGSVNFYLPPYV
jgi:hypothetical protein